MVQILDKEINVRANIWPEDQSQGKYLTGERIIGRGAVDGQVLGREKMNGQMLGRKTTGGHHLTGKAMGKGTSIW